MADEKTGLFTHASYYFSLPEPTVGASIGIPHAYNTVNQATAETLNYKFRAERVSKLEETRNTIAAEVKAAMAEAVAEVKVLKAETISELKISYVKEAAELHQKDMERQIADAKNQKRLPVPDPAGG